VCKAEEAVENCARSDMCRERAQVEFDVSKANLTVARQELREGAEREN